MIKFYNYLCVIIITNILNKRVTYFRVALKAQKNTKKHKKTQKITKKTQKNKVLKAQKIAKK